MVTAGDSGQATESAAEDAESPLARRLALAVIIAAVASVPATFLSALDGRAGQAGHVINYLSLAVLMGESVILLVMARDRRRWLRENRFVVTTALVCVPAVVFAIGPAQILRLVRFVGALRLLRVRRIFRAGRILRDRAGLTDWRWKVASTALSVVAAVFVAIVLADPTSRSRQFLDGHLDRFGVPTVALAGLVLGGATFVVVRYRDRLPISTARQREPQGADEPA